MIRILESSTLGGDSEHGSPIDLSSKEEEAASRCDQCVADHLAPGETKLQRLWPNLFVRTFLSEPFR